jgi:hypothetical protein
MSRGRGLRISSKHGVNACLPVCFLCQETKNEVALLGYLPGDVEAPRRAVLDRRPCDGCRALMTRGIILISTRDGETGENPYRSGGWVVVTEDAIRRWVTAQAMLARVLEKRMAFVEDAVWNGIGLPRAAVAVK